MSGASSLTRQPQQLSRRLSLCDMACAIQTMTTSSQPKKQLVVVATGVED